MPNGDHGSTPMTRSRYLATVVDWSGSQGIKSSRHPTIWKNPKIIFPVQASFLVSDVFHREVLIERIMEPEPAEPTPVSRSVVESLYARHAEELRRFLWGVLRDADAVQDVFQSSLLIALKEGATAREETMKGWIFRVAYHEALQYRRRLGTTRKVLSQAVWIAKTAVAGADDELQRKETQQEVREALDRLPETEQEVVRLRIHQDLTFAEVALELGIPLGTVLTRMRSALQKLRQKLSRETR